MPDVDFSAFAADVFTYKLFVEAVDLQNVVRFDFG